MSPKAHQSPLTVDLCEGSFNKLKIVQFHPLCMRNKHIQILVVETLFYYAVERA